MDRSFPKQNRLLRTKDFARLQSETVAKKLFSKHLLILVAESPTGVSRLGLTVTTKIDKRAVVRNRIKRRMREIFRAMKSSLATPLDISVIARRDTQQCALRDLRREFRGALFHAGYLRDDRANQADSAPRSADRSEKP